MNRIARVLCVLGVIIGIAASACGGDDQADGDLPFELIVHPEFVQGLHGGSSVTVLVSVEDPERAAAVSLEAAYSGGVVEVQPSTIGPGELAEVTIEANAVSEETQTELTVTARRGSITRTATRAIAVVPGNDDLGPMASDLLALFTAWLEGSTPDLGIDRESQFEGRVVAPMLLVVSHYMFENDQYELGLSWHVTISPNDWAELYLRPRDQLLPTRAFRLSSWTAGLAGEPVEFTEVPPPSEVVR
jgi:hypothetical protein